MKLCETVRPGYQEGIWIVSFPILSNSSVKIDLLNSSIWSKVAFSWLPSNQSCDERLIDAIFGRPLFSYDSDIV